MDVKKFDKRIIDRNLKEGRVSKQEYEAYLKSLPDVAGQSEVIDIPLFPKDKAADQAAAAGQAEDTDCQATDGDIEGGVAP